MRAPTPSGAAELVAPDQAEWRRRLTTLATRLATRGRRSLEARFQTVDWLGRRLLQGSPAATVRRQRDWLRNLRQVLSGAIRHDLASRRLSLQDARTALLQRSPALGLQRSVSRMAALQQRLETAGDNALQRATQRLRLSARALDSVSPLATLDRGYAIVTDAKSGRVLTDASAVKPGTGISARLASGSLEATVTQTEGGTDAGED
jgi:exodeoxyribonuclease VII large subunit